MSDFDPIKAQREILTGLLDVHKIIQTRAREAEQRHSEAEAEYNSLVKVERFTFDLVERERAKLKALEDAATMSSTT